MGDPLYIKNQSFQNMTIIKVARHFLYPSMKKKLRKIWLIFDIEKWPWKSEFCCFQPSILKWPKGQNIFIAFLSYLSLTYQPLNLQKNNFGHANQPRQKMLHEIGLDFYAIQAARTKRLHWRWVTDFLMKIDLESDFYFFHIIP